MLKEIFPNYLVALRMGEEAGGKQAGILEALGRSRGSLIVGDGITQQV